jgi:DNA mismatch repair protein MSH6
LDLSKERYELLNEQHHHSDSNIIINNKSKRKRQLDKTGQRRRHPSVILSDSENDGEEDDEFKDSNPNPELAKTPGGSGARDSTQHRRKHLAFESAMEKVDFTKLDNIQTPSPLAENVSSRFAQRESVRFPFLNPDTIRDAQRRRPDDPEYDPSTLYIPPEWYKQHKISEGQRQWWEFKALHWGSVLLFKMGKFYEMFEMDAHVGAECLGLSYMKGDQPHAGFPEAAYAQMASRLARAGHRVVVIEQTETPDQLAVRNEQRRKEGLKKDSVVRREKVAVLSCGTLTEAEMDGASDAQFVVALYEQNDVIGLVAVDVGASHMYLGQWTDDVLRSHLATVLTALGPVEVVSPPARYLTKATSKVISAVTSVIVKTHLPLGAWTTPTQAAAGNLKWAVDRMTSVHSVDIQNDTSALSALAGCMSFLKAAMLDQRVIQTTTIEPLPYSAVNIENANMATARETHLVLDAPALENLQILENERGGTTGTLLAALEDCVTPFGRRRFKAWLTRPLARAGDIIARQDVVECMLGPASEAVYQARALLKEAGTSFDLERAVARLTATGVGVGSARDAPHVVLYEDASGARLKELLRVIDGLERVHNALSVLRATAAFENSNGVPDMTAAETRAIACGDDLQAALDALSGAADWEEARATGKLVPSPGVDPAYDVAMDASTAVQEDLDSYLKEVRQSLECNAIRYVSLNKESYVLEVPDTLRTAVPHDWYPLQGKKGAKRYSTARLKQLVARSDQAAEAVDEARKGMLKAICATFARFASVWKAAIGAVSVADCLMGLAARAASGGDRMSRPRILTLTSQCVFKAIALGHPVEASLDVNFVPNDITLGGDDDDPQPPMIVLTGPNMGGKSTLMRQVCLATVAAQVGAWVPARMLELTPADAVFVRMGARDKIVVGQSTFFVELSETAAALSRATRHSLVALDELGRGTATVEGGAIASAVLEYLANKVKCRGIFATHYHHICDSYNSQNSAVVAIKHMGCTVEPPLDEGGVERVTFLYRLTDGACPKSYGINVAKLAGLPESVVRRAVQVRKEWGWEELREEEEEEEEDNATKITTVLAEVVALLKAGDGRAAWEWGRTFLRKH